jgi:hypothetical protein
MEQNAHGINVWMQPLMPLRLPSASRGNSKRWSVRKLHRHDMCFASRENTLLGQPEVGVGVNPGSGGTERLPVYRAPAGRSSDRPE